MKSEYETVIFSRLCWIDASISHYNSINHHQHLVENFLFYADPFLMDCHFRDLPDFQCFESTLEQFNYLAKSQN